MIQFLSNVELETTTRGTVCSIMPTVGMFHPFSVKRGYNSQVEQILSVLSAELLSNLL